jgi:hypothetical protein
MIPIRKDTFSQEDIETNGSGAGIVLHSVDEAGVHRFLLGRERLSLWKGSCRWSGFEGSRKPGENLIRTAVREFLEESLDSVLPVGEAEAALEAERHELCVVLSVACDRRVARYHRTYLLRTEWKDGAEVDAFDAVRQKLDYVDRLVQEWRHFRPPLLTGVEVGRVDDLTPPPKKGEGVDAPPPPPPRARVTCACCVEARMDGGVPTILAPPWVCEGDAATAVVEGSEAANLLRWSALRAKLERAAFDHPALRIRRADGGDGGAGQPLSLQEADLHRDHLEKDQVRWWSAAELTEVLDGHGTRGADRFRPYFLPVLQTILTELNLFTGARGAARRETEVPPPRAHRTPSPLWRAGPCGPCAPIRP